MSEPTEMDPVFAALEATGEPPPYISVDGDKCYLDGFFNAASLKMIAAIMDAASPEQE